MNKKDLSFSLLVGLAIGLIWTPIFIRLGTLNFLGLGRGVWVLVIIVPIGTLVATYIGSMLSQWKAFFSSLVRFAIVGVLNTGVDLGVFNLLIYITNTEKGSQLGWFKGTSFIVAAVNSYFFNKFWTFDAGGTKNQAGEFVKYFFVTVIGFGINVGVTYVIANRISPLLGFSQLSWDSIAAVAATAISLIWNFLGYRFIVFKNKSHVTSSIS